MTPVAATGRAEPFFLESAPGTRFCLFHPPAGEAVRGAVLYVHPFGEEMNKARRMAALQARALAALGYGVLQLDLYGCGDSSGDFGDARWEIWKQDLAAGYEWLRQRVDAPVSLLGLRLGATLALDYACGAPHTPARLVLWQPVHSGAAFMTQFLRLRMASEMLSDSQEKGQGTQALRDALGGGAMLEIAGYDIAPALAGAIDALDATQLALAGCEVHWLEIATAAGRGLPPAAAKVATVWQQRGVKLHTQVVACPPFWSTQEVTECPALVAATSSIFSGGPQ